VGLAGALAFGVMFTIHKRDYFERQDMRTVLTLWLCASVVCDLLITGAIVVKLAKYKQRTTFTPTKRLLRTLTRNTVENGLVTSVFALLNAVLYFTRYKQDNLHLIFQYTTGRLYAVVLLTSMRRAQSSSSVHTTTRSGTASGSGGPAGTSGGIPLRTHRAGHAPLHITVQRTVDREAPASEYDADAKGAAAGWEGQSVKEARDGRDLHDTPKAYIV